MIAFSKITGPFNHRPKLIMPKAEKKPMPLQNQKPVFFLASANPVQSKAFYQDVLGFTCVEDTEFVLVFTLGDTHLRVQKVAKHTPQPYTSMGWDVEDIKSVVTTMTNNGVIFDHFDGLAQTSDGIWHSPSTAQIAWFKDPDDNTLSLTQL